MRTKQIFQISLLTLGLAFIFSGCSNEQVVKKEVSAFDSINFQKITDETEADLSLSQKNALKLVFNIANNLTPINALGDVERYRSDDDDSLRNPRRVYLLLKQVIEDARSARVQSKKDEDHEIDQNYICTHEGEDASGRFDVLGNAALRYEKKTVATDTKPEQASLVQNASGKIKASRCGKIMNSTLQHMLPYPVLHSGSSNSEEYEKYQKEVETYNQQKKELLPRIIQTVDGEISVIGSLKANAKADPKIRVVNPDRNQDIAEEYRQALSSVEMESSAQVLIDGKISAVGFDSESKEFKTHHIGLRDFAVLGVMNQDQLQESASVGRNNLVTKDENDKEKEEFARKLLACAGEIIIDGKSYPCTQIMNTITKIPNQNS